MTLPSTTRRAFLGSVAASGLAASAGCLSTLGFSRQSAWRDPPVVADRPAAVYVPAVVEGMRPHIAVHLAEGGKLAQVTRHMLGLFAGLPGARQWRRVLSEQGHRDGAGLDVLDRALAAMEQAAA